MPEDLPHVALIGKAGAGKTAVAHMLEEHYNYTRLSFAEPLKDVAEMIWDEQARKDRSILQPLGHKVREIDPDAWVNSLERRFHSLDALTVIDDCRFPNEADRLVNLGFQLVRIYAPYDMRVTRLQRNGKFQTHEQLGHISECALDHRSADTAILNNGSWENLEAGVVVALERLQRKVP